jgi:hypothetical protein
MDTIELRKAGLDALNTALGPDNAQAFLRQYGGTGDFTKERHEQPEPSNEEIFAGIMRLQEERADIITAKNARYMERMAARKAGSAG